MNALARTPILVATGLAMLLLGAGFALVQPALGGTLLDTLHSPEAARDLIADLAPAQNRAHLWTTLLLDTAYPLAYGAFFAGLIWRLGGRRASLLPVAAMMADLFENALQAAALAGWTAPLGAKMVLTPLKFGLLAVSLLVIMGLLVRALASRFGQKRS